MISWLRQVVSVTRLSLQTLGQRFGTAAVAVVGIAGVVLVLVAVLSIAEGIRSVLVRTGDPSAALVLRAGSDSETTSAIRLEETRLIADAPGVRRDGQQPLASAELFVIINLPMKASGAEANVPLRGVEPIAFEVHDEIEILEGRPFEPGRKELIVGIGARDQFIGLDLGSEVELGENDWKVVGIFSSGGTLAESELWSDARVLQPAYRRGTSFQSVHAKLESAASFATFKDALTADPRLNVKVLRQDEYFASQSEQVTIIIRALGIVVALLMGIGAVFSALNTMYSAVAARTREIATLRALGFASGPVVISVLAEALLLALGGGLLGGVVAYLAFNGYRAATLNWSSFSQVTFSFAVTPGLLVLGAVYAIILGFFGGLLPAIRAARMPVATALRES